MVTQMTSECLAPCTERRLTDIEPFAVLADGLHDNVDVRMWFIGMKGQGVPMLGCIFFLGEVAHGC
jgi:hypothetical protein